MHSNREGRNKQSKLSVRRKFTGLKIFTDIVLIYYNYLINLGSITFRKGRNKVFHFMDYLKREC